MMDSASCESDQSQFLFGSEALWIVDIEIELRFGLSLIYILPAMSSAFCEMEMEFLLNNIFYDLISSHFFYEK